MINIIYTEYGNKRVEVERTIENVIENIVENTIWIKEEAQETEDKKELEEYLEFYNNLTECRYLDDVEDVCYNYFLDNWTGCRDIEIY